MLRVRKEKKRDMRVDKKKDMRPEQRFRRKKCVDMFVCERERRETERNTRGSERERKRERRQEMGGREGARMKKKKPQPLSKIWREDTSSSAGAGDPNIISPQICVHILTTIYVILLNLVVWGHTVVPQI